VLFVFLDILFLLLLDSRDDLVFNLGDLGVSFDFGFNLLELNLKILGLLGISKLSLLLLKGSDSSFGNF
jgi:hypothetical protein